MSKKQVEDLVSKGGTYIALTGKGSVTEELGYVTGIKNLRAAIVAFAIRASVRKIQVHTGRNIMDCGNGPSAKYTVSLQVD